MRGSSSEEDDSIRPAHSSDGAAHAFPVSIKGVVIRRDEVILLKNERDEWELPGGKLEKGESPEGCLLREIAEELGFIARVDHLLDAWAFDVIPGVPVLILAYGCYVDRNFRLRHSSEHRDVATFPVAHLDQIKLPDGYKRSIARWHSKLRAICG